TFWTTLQPRTAFKAVRELPPGHSLVWKDGSISVTEYWRPTFADADEPPQPEEVSVRALQDVLEDATRIRLRSDVPVGAYLSGGLDSSLIVAMTKRVSDAPLKTFSVSFDDLNLDERVSQRQAARAFQTDHSELRCSNADIARAFPEVVSH